MIRCLDLNKFEMRIVSMEIHIELKQILLLVYTKVNTTVFTDKEIGYPINCRFIHLISSHFI